MRSVCQNKWCKATFEHINEFSELEKRECPKCKSLSSELSDGVTWTDKTYEGSRWDGAPHQMQIKVSRYHK